MFIAALFTITKIWKPSKCPLVDERIKKMRSVYTLEWYAVFKQEGGSDTYNNIDEPRVRYC